MSVGWDFVVDSGGVLIPLTLQLAKERTEGKQKAGWKGSCSKAQTPGACGFSQA